METTARRRDPVGYPVVLELSAACLVATQLLLSWLALDRLPATVVPYFGLGASAAGLANAAADARLWLWMVVGLWSLLLLTSAALYRAIRTTPIPILSVALFAFLAILRAGVIALNLNPVASPRQALLRAILVGIVALLLGVVVERFRSRRRLGPLLIGQAHYDEPTPRGFAFLLVVGLGLGIPAILVPTRVRVLDEGVLVITPVSYFLIPMVSIERIERAGALQALAGAGINLAANPGSAVRIFRIRRFFPVVFSVTAPDRFIKAVEEVIGRRA